MLKIKSQLKDAIYSLLKDRYPLTLDELDIGYTPDIKMGDLALSFPFLLAKKIGKAPRDIAAEIAQQLAALPGVTKSDIAGAGYVNLFLDRHSFFRQMLHKAGESTLTPDKTKVIVEHTSINPNKAAHIGHLRNSTLGDTLVRCLQYKGENVEIQNYIDDTGVQVADVVFGFMDMEQKSLDEIKSLPGKFDFYCWDLYTRVHSYIQEHPESEARRAQIIKHIEEDKGLEAEYALYISRRILKAHLDTMWRLGITYDLQACESSIIRLKFWEKAFSLLKEKNAIYYVSEGENQGCWVMKLEEEPALEKILVRSNNTVTYTGKDIAYQLWKFGLLDQDFFYSPFIEQDGKTIWITTSEKTSHSHEFGHGDLVYNVIDVRQSYPQKIVAQGLKSLKFFEQSENSIHFSYEMVALSPESLKELNQDISEEDQDKDFLEVSGRKGLGIKADDLLDRLEDKAFTEVDKRNPEFSSEKKQEIGHKIAIGALRYFMLKFARNSIIVFDFADALSFEGETGPYLQYTLVRINSIFRKLQEQAVFSEDELKILLSIDQLPLEKLNEAEAIDFWELILFASQMDEEVLHSIRSLEFLHLAKYTFNLCQKFNAYYHKYPILNEKDEDLRNIRILTIDYVRETLKTALHLMGIPQPERM